MHPLRSVLLLVSFLTLGAFGQSGKAFFKEGEKLRAQQQLEPALEKYTLAIQVDPKLVAAYVARADVYGLLGRNAERAADLAAAYAADPSDADAGAAAAMAYLEVDSARKALALCDGALRVNAKHMKALQAKVRACLALNDLDCASTAADAALALKATTDTYYLHGLVRTATRDYKTAEFDLDKVVEWNPMYEAAYVAQSEVQLKLYEQYTGPTMQMRTLEKAIAKCTRALELNPQSTDALFSRSKALALQKEYAKAIDDVSRCMALGRTDRAVYLQRARYYHGYGQHQNAVNDLNKPLLADPRDMELLLFRAECREANLDLEGAINDLDAAKRIMDGNAAYDADFRRKVQEQRDRVDRQLFEMNRESDPPVITIVDPVHRGGVAQISSVLTRVKVDGHVRDRNKLKRITVNGMEADFARDERDPEFFVAIPIGVNDKELVVTAVDVYDNESTVSLRVERNEGVPPVVALTAPDPGSDRIIHISATREDLFIEGTVSDASNIRSITVDGILASYVPDTNRTDFSMKLVIAGKDRFTVRAEDQFGNGTDVVYQLQRKAEAVAVVKPAEPTGTEPKPAEKPAEKPMAGAAVTSGTTWVIYIENSDYKSFPALPGAGSDVAKMQKAFAKYNVQKTITKKNLTKQQLERFFSTELRDLVRTNKVNTVLVWYAGHGRTVGGKSFWIPVDAKKDDIYSFYNYGPLKNLIQNYSESVSNALVVSDAAGSEASFYDLSR
ncbi:MAG: caspase family protein [Flavobacteriales bacterium]|nr:caspase family protein [Flavobacteriales bacterium]